MLCGGFRDDKERLAKPVEQTPALLIVQPADIRPGVPGNGWLDSVVLCQLFGLGQPQVEQVRILGARGGEGLGLKADAEGAVVLEDGLSALQLALAVGSIGADGGQHAGGQEQQK